MEQDKPQRVQTFGRKKKATAVALVKPGTGKIRVNGVPLDLLTPASLRVKAEEPIHVLGAEHFKTLDFRVRVRGGGSIAQVYAIRQALAKGVVAFAQRFVDEATRKELRDTLVAFDRSLVVADIRRTEAKKAGGRGARARFQKSYR